MDGISQSMEKLVNKKYIPGFDILKILMAIFIVSIHAQAFTGTDMISALLRELQGTAVAIFFVLSSIFFFKKVRQEGHKISLLNHYLTRIGILYAFWFVINLPLIIHSKDYFTSIAGGGG